MKTKWSNQYKRRRNYYPSIGGPLDHGQKARICILAREAYDSLGTSFLPFDAWRQMEQQNAVGKDSLRDCVQADYLKLRAHFEELAGESGRAVETHLADAMKPGAIALLKLREACAERGLKMEYPGAICRRQYKCAIEEANASQLWQLVFTVRNRRKPIDLEAALAGDTPATTGRVMDCPF